MERCAEKKEKARIVMIHQLFLLLFFSEGRNYLKGYEHVSILVRLFRGVFVIVNVRGFLGDE